MSISVEEMSAQTQALSCALANVAWKMNEENEITDIRVVVAGALRFFISSVLALPTPMPLNQVMTAVGVAYGEMAAEAAIRAAGANDA